MVLFTAAVTSFYIILYAKREYNITGAAVVSKAKKNSTKPACQEEENKRMPKISVLIPVYHVEKYLSQCLNSVINQSEKDIEIICVEDGSDDGSAAILDDFSKDDHRIKVIKHSHNMGLCKSRKDAVKAATGEYIMFLDSDDYLEKNACEELYIEIENKNVDVIQFGAILEPEYGVSQELIDWTANFMEPREGYISGDDLLTKCFEDGDINCNLVNKIWNASICKKAYTKIDDSYINSAEDRYASFILLYFANSGYGLSDRKYYHYRMGTGVTGGTELTLKQFKNRCTGAKVCNKIELFLKEENAFDRYAGITEKFDADIKNDCVDCWYRKLADHDLNDGWEELKKYWDNKDIVSYFSDRFFEEQQEVYRKFCLRDRKNLILYYRYVGYREMDSVMTSYIAANRDKKVIVVTDQGAPLSHEITEYCGCDVIRIPDADRSNWTDYRRRADALAEIILKEAIAECIYLSPTSHIATLDRILVESYEVSFFMAQDEYLVDKNSDQRKKLEEKLEELRDIERKYEDMKEIQDKYEKIKNEYHQLRNSRFYRIYRKLRKLKNRVTGK